MHQKFGLLDYGDELGVFNSEGRLLGSTVYQGDKMGILIYGDDLTTEDRDGMLENESYELRHWSKWADTEQIIELEYEEGSAIYEKDEIAYARFPHKQMTGLEEALNPQVQFYPNPAKSQIVFALNLPDLVADGMIKIYDAKGTLQSEIRAGQMTSGLHQFQQDLSHFQSGVYFFQLLIEGKVQTGSFVVMD